VTGTIKFLGVGIDSSCILEVDLIMTAAGVTGIGLPGDPGRKWDFPQKITPPGNRLNPEYQEV